MEANAIQDLAESLGLDYINFLQMDIVDFNTDMRDPSSHMNYSGAIKVSSWLGNYVRDNYSIPSRRGDVSFSWMETAFEESRSQLHSYIHEANYLENILLVMCDKGYSFTISIDQDSPIYEDQRLLTLIENLSPDTDLEKLDQAAQLKEAYLLCIDRGSCLIQEYLGEEVPESIELMDQSLSIGGQGQIHCTLADNRDGSIFQLNFSLPQGESFVCLR